MTFAKRLVCMMTAVTLTLAVAACPAFFAALPKIVSAVADSSLVLDQISSFVDMYFASKPDSPVATMVRQKLAGARDALITAQRALEGIGEANQAQVDAAFASFRAAYTALTEAIAALDGVTVAPATGNRFQASAKVTGPAIVGQSPQIRTVDLDVPVPAAFNLKL